IPALSGTWAAALIALWVSLVVALIGCSVLSRLRISSPALLAKRLAIAFPLGFATVAFLTLALALVRQLTPASAWVLLCMLTLVEWKAGVTVGRELRSWWATRSPWDLESRVLLLLIACMFVINLTWSVAPEVQYDALNYHLAVPKLYLEAH